MTKKHLFQNGLAFLMCLFLFAGLSAQTTKRVNVESSGTWTVPSTLDGHPITVTSVYFEAWGGGGAGGYAFSNNAILRPTAGGGGAAYAKSATITDMTPGESFTVVVGAGGTAVGNSSSDYTITDGGISTVTRGTDLLVKAVGGKTVTGYQNWNNPGAGGSASDCEGVVKYSGGHGGKADLGGYDNGSFCISGSGGGAAGPNGNGGDAADSWGEWKPFSWSPVWYKQITGAVGNGGGGLAGSGAQGWESQIIGGGGWGNQEGRKGNNYGGGGSGAISNNVSYGDANGGAGGPGVVRVTFTYISSESIIDVDNVTENFCSGSAISIPLNVTLTDVLPADVSVKSLSSSDLANEAITYNSVAGKFFFTADAYTNTTNATKTFTLTCKLKNNTTVESNEFTVTVNVYGKLDGGKIAKDQYVCNGQNFVMFTNEVSASGGKGGQYQWRIADDITGPFSDISGATSATYTPTELGVHFYQRAYIDECGTENAVNKDVPTLTYLDAFNVNPFNPGKMNKTDEVFCPADATDYTTTLTASPSSTSITSFSGHLYKIYWQKSTDEGATWTDVANAYYDVNPNYTVTIPAADMVSGAKFQYRYLVELYASEALADCPLVPCNDVFTVTVKYVPDYTSQFKKDTITLWYGACDTSIVGKAAPSLNPAPESITGPTCSEGTRLAPGTYDIVWTVTYDGCPKEYTQSLTVEYPACGTLTDPLPMTDNDGIEYQTIRIGCECWMAENLRTNAPEAVYYDEDAANEQFGKLYTWADAVGCNETPKETKSGATYVQGILPDEWSIPTMAQYSKLLEYFSTEQLKSDAAGTWLPDHLGTNESGFNLMGSGYYDVEFQRLLGYADFWVVGATSSNPDKAPVAEFRYDCDGTINCVFKQKTAKMSVRGVRVSPK